MLRAQSEEGPFTLDDVGRILLLMLKEQRITNKILEEWSVCEGSTITNTFTLQPGTQVTKIDWVEAKHQGIPRGASFEVPLKPVQKLLITNLGPSPKVFYATNKPLSSTEAAEPVRMGETMKFSLKKRAITYLNIVTNEQPATVRVTAII